MHPVPRSGDYEGEDEAISAIGQGIRGAAFTLSLPMMNECLLL